MTKYAPNHLIADSASFSDEILAEIANKYETPLYVYDVALIKSRWEMLSNFLTDKISLYYSIKANPNKHIIDIFRSLGASFEVTSIGELRTVLEERKMGDKIIFVGPGKTEKELEFTISNASSTIIIESLNEANKIQNICNSNNVFVDAALRINPGKGKGTIVMGGATQFGMDKQIAIDILNANNEFDRINFRGIHSYLGTGNLQGDIILEHTDLILRIADEIRISTNRKFDFIDIGGGIGIPYYDGDIEIDLESLKIPFHAIIDRYKKNNAGISDFVFEAGRYLIGPAGVFLTTVVDVKRTLYGTFVIVDGGTNVFGGDNKYRGYKPTPMRLLNKKTEYQEVLTICGPLCTSSDRLASDIIFPLPEIGDIIAFYQAGAYGLSASPGLFLSHGYPREVLVENGNFKIIRDIESKSSKLN